jgi:hypothetical protein
MLIIKPYVNYTPMEDDQEIWIHNVDTDLPNGICKYKIKKPEGHDHHAIYHKRTDSWMVLTERVLRILNNGE